ncbi:MAG: hypothetical protein ACKKMR_03615 [Candidatus Nealsonbacteria bacterium]
MTRKKESPPKCPKCGSIKTNVRSRIVGGLIVQEVKKDGTVGPSPGARKITHVSCAKCGTELKNHPDHIPDGVKKILEDLEQYKE